MSQVIVGSVRNADGSGLVRIFVGKELWATVAPGAEATALEGMVRTHAGQGRDVWNPVIRQMMFAECFGPEGLTLCEKSPEEPAVPEKIAEEWSKAVEAAAESVKPLPSDSVGGRLSRLEDRVRWLEQEMVSLRSSLGASAVSDPSGGVAPGN